MGTRENKVETYLRGQVKVLGGDTRKWVSPGRDGVPDQIVLGFPEIFFCEVKTCEGVHSHAQYREHTRLRDLGASVCTVYGNKGVDQLIKDLILHKRPLGNYYA